MRHRLQWFIYVRAGGRSKGDEHPTCTLPYTGLSNLIYYYYYTAIRHTDFNEDMTNESASVSWPVATYGCGSWTLRKNEKTHLLTLLR